MDARNSGDSAGRGEITQADLHDMRALVGEPKAGS